MDTLNDLNERVDAFVGTSSFDTPAAANDQAPIDVPAEVHEDIVASVDFSEVELADEFTEPQVAVTPNGLLPMEPLPIDGRLRKAALRMPDEIEEASGFTLFGRRIKSLVFTTDVAIIKNVNSRKMGKKDIIKICFSFFSVIIRYLFECSFFCVQAYAGKISSHFSKV